MRMARIKIQGRCAVYHCISRIVGGQPLLDDLGKETLVRMVRQLAAFCGLEFLVSPDGRIFVSDFKSRIRVVHRVTEMVSRIDIVAQQLALAAGLPLGLRHCTLAGP